ncbi:NAD(P)H-dependent oxidoreductase [Luteimonas sp. SJ-92]|uniref:NAD(P)H-dependent oxidoreductase n=1 Tax=Luteimonas salinisoli TaxID=2752307 RepID=A0A853J7T3_9GAMM|nr:NAD(P)H-dependent oxidoreductase [Luteimonas salinisoli]NZA24935.1 NAD(P)H-dependent oxidoreductase [Luteimonas salinisoli]
MKVLSLLAHPRSTSFCHAISARACAALRAAGHEVVHHDLYEDGFEPRLMADEAYSIGDSVEQALARSTDPLLRQYRKTVAEAEGLLIVHPNWWGKPPAILSGWLDRVLVPGVAYRLERAEGRPEGLLVARRALIFNTSDTPEERERDEFGDPLELIWGRCVLPFCGVERYRRIVFRPVVDSAPAQRAQWLESVETAVEAAFAGKPGEAWD